MIASNFLVACTVLSFWPHATRCENDASLELGKTALSGSAELGFRRAHESSANNSDINHVKPVLTNVDASKKDYQKYRNGLYGSIRRMDSLGNNINLNVNHRDYTNRRWKKRQLGYPIYRKDWNKIRDSYQDERNRLFKVIRLRPNFHAGDNVVDPRSEKRGYEQRNPKRKQTKSRKENGSDEFAIIGGNDDQCNSIVEGALEYVKNVEIDLLNLESDLRLLLVESQNMAPNTDHVDLYSK